MFGRGRFLVLRVVVVVVLFVVFFKVLFDSFYYVCFSTQKSFPKNPLFVLKCCRARARRIPPPKNEWRARQPRLVLEETTTTGVVVLLLLLLSAIVIPCERPRQRYDIHPPKRGKNSRTTLCLFLLFASSSASTDKSLLLLLLATKQSDGKDAVVVGVSVSKSSSSSQRKEKRERHHHHPKTTVAFGRTTPIRDSLQTKKQTVSISPEKSERAIEREPPVEQQDAPPTAQKTHSRRKVSSGVESCVSTLKAPSPRVKRAMEYARHRMMMERTHHARDGSATTASQNMTTSERVARILAAAKAKVNNKSNIASDKTDPEPSVIEEGKNKTRVEKAAEDVVVAPMPSKATTTVIESKGKNVEEEAIGVAVVREDAQNGGQNIEAAVAPIPAPPPPPSAVTRAVALQSLATKKESFKSLPNANQSAFWLKKCNAALAVGDEGAACLALRTGISRKAQPMEELSEKLKELVTMKMNEAIEASEKTENKKCEREEEEEATTPKEEEVAKAKETVDDDTNTAPRSASSSEEFEFKTIQKAETADFAAKAAIERENKLMVSEAMAMIVRESPTTEMPRRQSMDNKSQRTLDYEGATTTTPKPASTANQTDDEEFAFRVSPMAQDATELDQPATPSSSPPTASPLTIFAKLMGKIITDTLEFTDEAARKAAAAHSPPQIIRTMSPAEPRISPTLLNSPNVSPRSPIRRQHSLDMKKFYEEEEVEAKLTPKQEQQETQLSPSKTPWSQLKKVKDVKRERKSTIKKKKMSTPRRPKLDR